MFSPGHLGAFRMDLKDASSGVSCDCDPVLRKHGFFLLSFLGSVLRVNGHQKHALMQQILNSSLQLLLPWRKPLILLCHHWCADRVIQT
ncbi:hypothetical protein Pfo_006223 [Paulownia fortunei]|nr:hypothetical protein Pfo_006223 [Paulownia fortunei]